MSAASVATTPKPPTPAALKRDANRAFRTARWHRETVTRALEGMLTIVDELPDDVLFDLVRAGQCTPTADGFGTGAQTRAGLNGEQVVMARVSGTGTDTRLTSVEAAAAIRVETPPIPDPAGLALAQCFEALWRMSNLACDVDRCVGFLVNVRDRAKGRQSSLQGDCECCGASVSGAGDGDRLRWGYCWACAERWRSQGKPDRGRFVDAWRVAHPGGRQPVVDAGLAPASGVASVVTGGFVSGVGEVGPGQTEPAGQGHP